MHVIPALRYRDCVAALEWLCRAFGFERHVVVEGDAVPIVHAQLKIGGGMIMIGSVRDGDYVALQHPADARGVTQTTLVVVEDIDAHYARAMAAGAEVVADLEAVPQGGKLYTVKDPEGFVWSFGDYDPWA